MTDAHIFPDKEDAAERYLLGQMTDADRDAYEQHFFHCVECADEVKATARFMDSCKSALADQTGAVRSIARHDRRAWPPRRMAMVLGGALAATLALSVYQNVVTIPALTQAMAPRALTAVSFAASTSRGQAAAVIAAPRNETFVLFVDIPPGPFDGYDCAILATDGRVAITMPVRAAQARDAVPLLIPAGLLEPGDYTLVTTGRPRRAGDAPVEVARFPFTLRFAD